MTDFEDIPKPKLRFIASRALMISSPQAHAVLHICPDEKLYLLHCAQVWIFFNREKKLVTSGAFDYNTYTDIKPGKAGFVNTAWSSTQQRETEYILGLFSGCFYKYNFT